MNPSQLLYTATHEWVYVSESGGEKLATVGLTQYAVESLTDLIFLELPQPGQQVQAGKPLGVNNLAVSFLPQPRMGLPDAPCAAPQASIGEHPLGFRLTNALFTLNRGSRASTPGYSRAALRAGV